jgi:hypothetical protein
LVGRDDTLLLMIGLAGESDTRRRGREREDAGGKNRASAMREERLARQRTEQPLLPIDRTCRVKPKPPMITWLEQMPVQRCHVCLPGRMAPS